MVGDDLIRISNDVLQVQIATRGAAIVSVTRRDSGRDFVLGPADQDWEPHHLGAVMGRFARIVPAGRLVIDGVAHQLSRNAGPHHLHGGNIGFSRRPWVVAKHRPDELLLTLDSEHGDEGYPGNVVVHARFQVVGSRLSTWLGGQTDRPTLFGPCAHPFFNLSPGTIDDLTLRAEVADRLVQDEDFVPTGARADASWLRAGIALRGVSLDDCFVPAHVPWCTALRGLDDAAVILRSQAPGLAIYTGDQLPDAREGICLQASPLPLEPTPSDPSVPVLRPGRPYLVMTTYDFLEQIDEVEP